MVCLTELFQLKKGLQSIGGSLLICAKLASIYTRLALYLSEVNVPSTLLGLTTAIILQQEFSNHDLHQNYHHLLYDYYRSQCELLRCVWHSNHHPVIHPNLRYIKVNSYHLKLFSFHHLVLHLFQL